METWGKIASCIIAQAGYLSFMYVVIVFLVAMDLWSGVRKAKKRGEARMSFGYRRTIDKLAKYFNTIFVVAVVDLVFLISPIYEGLTVIPAFPYITAIGVIFIGFIEFKSIQEKAEDKLRFKSTSMLAGKIIANKDDISKIVEEVMSYLNTPDREYTKGDKKAGE